MLQDPFVALDPSGECGVLRAKADRNRQLLLDFAIHIYNVNDRIVLKEQIEVSIVYMKSFFIHY